MKIKKYVLLLIVVILALTSGCAKPKPAGLSDDQLTAVTENALRGLDANDFTQFTRDFSDQMNAAFSQEQFTSLRSMLQTASGQFVSVDKPTNLTNNGGYALYRFPAKYERETVYVTLSFLVGGEKVEGLWVDSSNLRNLPKQ